MDISVDIPEELSRYADGQTTLTCRAATVGEALTRILERYPALELRVISAKGHFYPYLPAFLNDEKLPAKGFANTALAEGDRLAFVIIASGG